MAEFIRNPRLHGSWQIGDRCCYWWIVDGTKIHKPATVLNLTNKRVVIKMDGGGHRVTTARFLETAHTCSNSVGRDGMAQLCLKPAGHEGNCA